MKLKLIELFAGIGSQAMALRNIGIDYETVGISEIDKFAIKSYEAIHGKVHNFGDIFKIEELPYCDLLTYSFPCFTKDSFVLTSKGYKSIDEIKFGDYVLTHKNRYKKVINIFNNGLHKVLSIKGMCIDEIKATLNHKFLIRTKERVWDNESRRYKRLFKKSEWKEAKKLTKNDYLGIAINQKSIIPKWDGIDFEWSDGRKTRHKNELSKFMENKDFWWLIGRYIADGWIRSQGGIVFGIGKKKQKEFEKKISNVFNFSRIEEKTVYKYHVPLKELEFFVTQFGRGAENKEITDTVINLPEGLLSCFLEGYMSGDGSFSSTCRLYKCTSTSRKLILGIGQCIAKVYKRPFAMYKNLRKPITVIEGRTVKQKNYYSLAYKLTKDKQDKAFYEDGYIWFPISSIEKIGKEEVFDIEVEGDHSFTVQNTIVHNCQDLSIAGQQKGISKDTKSGLLLEVERLLLKAKENRTLPKYLLLENVKNLVGKKFIKDFERWLDFLNSLGYYSNWEVLNAKDYGIPQNRERVFVVSSLDNIHYVFPKKQELKIKMKDLLEENVPEKYYLSEKALKGFLDKTNRNGFVRADRFKPHSENSKIAFTVKTTEGSRCTDNFIIQLGNLKATESFGGNPQTGRLYSPDGISPCLNTMQGGGREPKILQKARGFNKGGTKERIVPSITTSAWQENNFLKNGARIRKLTPLECWRLMGFSDTDYFATESAGISNTQLYKQAGNSIVVNVLEAIFRQLFFKKR